WFAVNYCLVAGAVWLRFGGGWWRLLHRTAPYEALSTGALLLLGPVLSAAAYRSAALIPFVLVPLYAVNRMARLSRDQAWQARLTSSRASGGTDSGSSCRGSPRSARRTCGRSS